MVQKVTRNPDYSDLDLDFILHPTTKDVVKKTGIDAIKRSVRNLILTNFYDRLFRPYIGSNVQRILFDNITPLTAIFLKNFIIETIVNFEPRVKLIEDRNNGGVIVQVNTDNNGYNVTISFNTVNINDTVVISFFLERLR